MLFRLPFIRSDIYVDLVLMYKETNVWAFVIYY